VTTRLFSLLMALAYRRFRKVGGRIWWAVIVLAWFARYLDQREPITPIRRKYRYRVRPGRELDVVVRDNEVA
jgi:hypothetical protein